MNNNSPCQESDLGLSFQDRIDTLFHELELAVRWERPSILFAIYKSGTTRDEVNALLIEKLKSIGQETRSIRADHANQFDLLSQIPKLPDLPRTVLLIEGFNWDCGKEGARVLKEFNQHREYFIDNNIRAIFWLFENEVSDFATEATECWILRHRVVEFVDVPQRAQVLMQYLDVLWQSAENSSADESLSGRFLDEILNLQDSEKINTTNASGLLSLGVLCWRKGNFQNALKCLQASEEMAAILAERSLQAQCQNALALVHADLGNIDAAVLSYQRAISLSPESDFLWNNLGQLLLKKERNEDAINAFQKALESSPQDFLSWDGLGAAYTRLGIYQNAIVAFKKALEIAPSYGISLAGIGKAYLESGQLNHAKDAFRKAIELDVHLMDAWINLGKCFVQQKCEMEAITVYHRAIEFNPQDSIVWDELGKLHLKRQNYAESISAFQKVISLNPRNGEAYIRLASTLFQIGDYEASALTYQAGIPLFDDNIARSALWALLGETYVQMKDYEKAIEAYKQSEQLKSENKGSSQKLDQNCESSKREGEDVGVAGSSAAPTPNTAHVIEMMQNNNGKERGEDMIEANTLFDLKTAAEWNEHGNRHLKAGAYNDAIAAYTKAIELAPDACWPYIQNLAYVQYQKGKAKGKQAVGTTEDPDIWEGEEDADTAAISSFDVRKDPERNSDIGEPGLEKPHRAQPTGQIQTNNAECKMDSDTPEFTDALPQNPMDWNELGNSYAGSKKFDDAIAAYKKAIELEPQNGQPYSNLGFVYYLQGKYDMAIQLYKKSIDLLDAREEQSASWNRLGDAYRRLGDYSNALLENIAAG
jgi:tetratricopeptide (TPR) repeat protein